MQCIEWKPLQVSKRIIKVKEANSFEKWNISLRDEQIRIFGKKI